MEYNIALSEDETYIVLSITGEMTREQAMQSNLEAHALGQELDIHRYLTDVREARNVDSVLGNYKFAYEDMKQTDEIDRGARVALLVSPEDHSHDFVETVSRNSGLDVTLFRDMEEAIEHLTKD